MCLQVDQEFQKNEIKDLNKKYNAEMFLIKIRGVTEQKFRELKKIISKLNLIN